LAGLTEGIDLGVIGAGAAVHADGQLGAVRCEQDTADRWIGKRRSDLSRGGDGTTHRVDLGLGGHRSPSRPARRTPGDGSDASATERRAPTIRTFTVGTGIPPVQPRPATRAGLGSRTVTAGSDLHRPRSTPSVCSYAPSLLPRLRAPTPVSRR